MHFTDTTASLELSLHEVAAHVGPLHQYPLITSSLTGKPLDEMSICSVGQVICQFDILHVILYRLGNVISYSYLLLQMKSNLLYYIKIL